MRDYRRAREQYMGTVHLFIGTVHSLYIITFIPFTINYNNDTEYHGFLSHFIFKSIHPFVLRLEMSMGTRYPPTRGEFPY
jgi:hypothetical protein